MIFFFTDAFESMYRIIIYLNQEAQTSSSGYYDKDNPLIAMRDNMENLVASGVLKLLEEHPERAAEILMEFADDPNIEDHL